MRKIVFRGKRIENGEWVEGYLVKLPSAIQIGSDYSPWYIIVPPVDPDDDGGRYNVDPETVGQYTGLTDKNGKKIFEWDVVKTEKFNAPNKLYIIKFDLLLGAFIGEDDGTMYFTTFDGDSDQFEVIGNIHDNPELLKGGSE